MGTMMMMVITTNTRYTTPRPPVHRNSSSSLVTTTVTSTSTSRRNVTLVTGAAPTGVVIFRLLGVADGSVGNDVLVDAAVGGDACVAYVCCACCFFGKLC